MLTLLLLGWNSRRHSNHKLQNVRQSPKTCFISSIFYEYIGENCLILARISSCFCAVGLCKLTYVGLSNCQLYGICTDRPIGKVHPPPSIYHLYLLICPYIRWISFYSIAISLWDLVSSSSFRHCLSVSKVVTLQPSEKQTIVKKLCNELRLVTIVSSVLKAAGCDLFQISCCSKLKQFVLWTGSDLSTLLHRHRRLEVSL